MLCVSLAPKTQQINVSGVGCGKWSSLPMISWLDGSSQDCELICYSTLTREVGVCVCVGGCSPLSYYSLRRVPHSSRETRGGWQMREPASPGLKWLKARLSPLALLFHLTSFTVWLQGQESGSGAQIKQVTLSPPHLIMSDFVTGPPERCWHVCIWNKQHLQLISSRTQDVRNGN